MTFGFYELSKIAWSFIEPETLLLLPLALALWWLWRDQRRLAVRSLTVGLVLVLAIGVLPLGDLMMAPLEARYPAEPRLGDVRAIIILGGATREQATARWGVPAVNEAAERFLAGATLARRFPKATVYFSGGSGRLFGSDVSEAIVGSRIFIDLGVDPTRLRLETKSRSTAENVRFLGQMIPARSTGQWVLVTSAYHMPRAMLTFCAAGWRRFIPYPTDFRTARFSDGIKWDLAEHLEELNIATKEWIGLWVYQLTGRAARSC
jgi:uncharacterized SAM-binding protein YcdF (DUF218 family)